MTKNTRRHGAAWPCAARVAASTLLGLGLAIALTAGVADEAEEGRGGYSLL